MERCGRGCRRRHRFSKADRIRATRQFREVIRDGAKVSHGGLSVFIRRHCRLERRLGLAIARRAGDAVARNRIRRRLREHFRLHRSEMPEGIDLVVVVNRDLSRVAPETFKAIVGELYRRAGLFRHSIPSACTKDFPHPQLRLP